MSTVRTQIWTSSILMAVSSVALLLSFIGWPADLLHIGTGLVLVWLAPGYALLLALFSQTLDRAWHIVLSLPASIVVVTLIGTLLDTNHQGLTDANFVWGLWTVSLVLTVVGLLRMRFSAPPVQNEQETDLASHTDAAQGGPTTPAPSRSLGRGLATAFGWAVLSTLLVGTIWWSAEHVLAATQVTSTPFTSLAIAHSTAKSQAPQVVVANHEGKSETYTVECWVEGKLAQRWDVGTIAPDQQWQTDLPEVSSATGAELKLFRAGETQPYRTAHALLRPN